LYRAIRRKEWFDPEDGKRVKAEAFMRRPKDQDGLSVFDSQRINQKDCIEANLSCHGVATLHVGTLRDHGLSIIRDPSDPKKILITDMPFENSNDEAQDTLLDAVAASARISNREKWVKPKS
jgi:hypothetical protein